MVLDRRAFAAAVSFLIACQVGAHRCHRQVAEAAGALCAIASGILWAVASLLPPSSALGAWLSFAAAVLAASAGACQLR